MEVELMRIPKDGGRSAAVDLDEGIEKDKGSTT